MWKIIAILGVGAPPGENPGSATASGINVRGRSPKTGILSVKRIGNGSINVEVLLEMYVNTVSLFKYFLNHEK